MENSALTVTVGDFATWIVGGGILLVAVIWTFIEHSVNGSWWFILPRLRPEAGDIRRKKVFLWLPKTVGGIRRFWERTEIVQVYSAAGTVTGHDWSPACWIDLGWGEFIEDVELERKFSMFGNPRGEIKPKYREGLLVVFSERPDR